MTVLTAPDIHAHNTFVQPNAVALRPVAVKTTASTVIVTIPPATVVAVKVNLS
jgi:alpha-L-arabinofuranosidase